MSNITRKQFLEISAAAGAALLLAACGTGEQRSDTQKPTAVAKSEDKKVGASGVSLPEMLDKSDPRYDTLRQGFNKRIDKHPALIALCTTTAEVAAAVKHARKRQLPVAVKSGGHSMEGFSCNDGGLVINLSKMNRVELMDNGRIKAEPGCTLSHLYDIILPKGRVLPAGSCASVCLGGLALGGGYGIFSRRYGLTCDHLAEATMVDGHGNIISTKDNPELLWALRGGGTGNFGVVTEMIFDTHPAPESLQAHYFKTRNVSAARAASILQTWMGLMPQLPDSCYSGYVLNGKTLNILITNYDAPTDKFMAQLQELAKVTDEFRSSKTGTLSRMVRNYYGRPGPLYFRNSSAGYFKGYGDVERFMPDVFEQIISNPGMVYQVSTLGGKIKDSSFAQVSCYPHRDYDFVSEVQAYWETPSQDARLAAATTKILQLTRDGGITTQYVNYCSLEFADWQNAYYGDGYKRLQEIKRRYDPDNIIRHPQSIAL